MNEKGFKNWLKKNWWLPALILLEGIIAFLGYIKTGNVLWLK